MRDLRRFAGLPWPDRLLLLKAAAVVALIRVALVVIPFRYIQRAAAEAPRGAKPAPPIERIVWAVAAASRRLPACTCLTQALAAQALLTRAGYDSHLELGVQKDDMDRFQAHAWLASGGRIVIGGRGAGDYTHLTAWKARV